MYTSVQFNDLQSQWNEIKEDVLQAVSRVGESGWLILGDEVRRFEAALAEIMSASFVVGCGNGMDAIEISLMALNISPGSKVLTSPLSAFATTLAIIRAKGIPVFAGIDTNGLLDLAHCREICASQPDIKYMVPVHLYGHALDLQSLERLKTDYELQIVEDCAQAIGATSRGRPVGSAGSVAAMSFYPTKNLGAMGDAGALLTNDPTIAEAARQLRDYGQSEKYIHTRIGYNSRLDELQAAIMSYALLPRLKRALERRQAIASQYLAGIENESLILMPGPDSSQSVWHLFPVRIAADREDFRAHLARRGIQTAIHYPVAIPDQPVMSEVTHGCEADLHSLREFCSSVVSLPVHAYMTDTQVEIVINACNEWQQ